MPTYLNEHQMGVDDTVLAFPNLLLCMGLVCLTDEKLYGIHLTDVGTSKGVMPTFSEWLDEQGVGGRRSAILTLYCAANLVSRYAAKAEPQRRQQWQTEMKHIAADLRYTGPVFGFDTSIVVPKNGCYVEFHAQRPANTCKIFYKHEEEMEYLRIRAPKGLPDIYEVKTENRVEQVEFATVGAAVKLTGSHEGRTDYPWCALRPNQGKIDYASRLICFANR